MKFKKTSTGIHSPLPQTSNTTVPSPASADPLAATSSCRWSEPTFHTDIISQAKLDAARRDFNAKFLRGGLLPGTHEHDSLELSQEAKPDDTRSEKEQRRFDKEERRRLRREKKDDDKQTYQQVVDESQGEIIDGAAGAPETQSCTPEDTQVMTVNGKRKRGRKQGEKGELEEECVPSISLAPDLEDRLATTPAKGEPHRRKRGKRSTI